MWSLFSLFRNKAVECKMSLADAMPLRNLMVREGQGGKQPWKLDAGYTSGSCWHTVLVSLLMQDYFLFV